jgi:hypothetical protein
MPGNAKNQKELEVLQQLNCGYLNSDQNGDVKWYSEVLAAEDFMSSLPDLLLCEKKQFLEMMAASRPFTELKAHDVKVRILEDFATIHARITFRTLDGVEREGQMIISGAMGSGSASR